LIIQSTLQLVHPYFSGFKRGGGAESDTPPFYSVIMYDFSLQIAEIFSENKKINTILSYTY